MPYGVIKVANEMLRQARADGRNLTPLQLIKLVYIAHGWSFSVMGCPLLNEQAQAWEYGPVIPSLYYAVRQYRSDPITDEIAGDTDPQLISEDDQEFIGAVYERYKHLSGTQLSSLTHMPGTPWSTVWEQAGRNALIPNDLIANHYQEKLDALAPESAA